MTTRILSDVLPLQVEPTRHRGIGQYTAKVLHGLLRQGVEGQAHLLAASGHLMQPDPFPSGPKGLWRLHYGDYPLARYRPDQWAYHLETYGEYWQKQIDRFAPQVLHIHSPFEWDVPLHSHHPRTPTVYTVYDLIPLRLEEHYLKKAPLWMQRGYRHVCDLLRRADHLITISQHSRQDIIDLLGVEPERISVAHAGPSVQFTGPPDPRVMASLRERFSLDSGFVISTAGLDYRKNLRRILESYSLLDGRLRQAHPLVIVCAMTSDGEAQLRSQARDLGIDANLVLADYVSDAELLALYHMATVQFLPSIYEGFGLPVLDAMLCGLPVITSSASSLPEVAGDAAVLVDPFDTDVMADALSHVLGSGEVQDDLRIRGLVQCKRFGWDRAVQVFQDVYRALAPALGPTVPRPGVQQRVPKVTSLALVSPLPPQMTGVADFAAYLMEALRQHVPVTAFVDPKQIGAVQRHVGGPVESITSLPGMVASGHVDAVLYQMGNSEFHHFALPYIAAVPGVTELHDGVLHGLVHSLTLAKGDKEEYWQELSYAHGQEGRGHADDVIAGHAPPALYDLTVNRRVVNEALGLVVHNAWSKAAVETHGTNVPIQTILHPVPVAESAANLPDQAACRLKLGIPEGAFVVSTFGRQTTSKRLPALLRAFARLRQGPREATLVLVGPVDAPSADLDVPGLIRELGLGGSVRLTGHVDRTAFVEHMAATDVGVNLRYPQAGETSGTLVYLLNAGVPVITSNVGSFAEFPDDCCWKVDVDEWEEGLLLAYLARLAADQPLRQQMRANAIRFAQDEIPTWDSVAEVYLEFLSRAVDEQAPLWLPNGMPHRLS